MGVGILCALGGVFWILPSIIILKKENQKSIKKLKGEYKIIGAVARGVYKIKYIVLIVIILAGVFMGYQASKIEFDMNMMNLEPKGIESIELMEYMVEKYDMSSNSFALQVDDLDQAYKLQEKFAEVDGVAEVASIAATFTHY